ncbi:MAG: imidazole glycerol phosphate synthase subunit HisF, partial [Deltaproteobacteria bacterium]|nr:imidazole glycerol phosphate synthase subunit HisF [Deltaproteobacteria bacterium]
SAALAASIFHFREYTINECKEFLLENDVPVRI